MFTPIIRLDGTAHGTEKLIKVEEVMGGATLVRVPTLQYANDEVRHAPTIFNAKQLQLDLDIH